MKGPALPHRAVVTLTGWAVPARKGVTVNGLDVRTSWCPEGEARVTLRAYPRTAPAGSLRDLFTFPRLVRSAEQPNGSSVSVIGQLLKLDRGEGLIKVKVCPSQATDLPFVITLHATASVLDLDPATFHVQVEGRVLRAASGLLLVESVTPVHAPVPARWHRWRPKRRPPQPFALHLLDEPLAVTLAS
ncbi:hypothetical protein V3W47_16480 [Deinococcus sp. YIM 134068]|uniref:hypothetical protein n=1 Tax=Deinococcus lichenicola TaxID=3118910 RepID=UPI002F955C15